VKEAVFPFQMFPEVDPVLGPEMRSTGEVLGISDNFGMAFYKSQAAAKQTLPTQGTVLISLFDKSDPLALKTARRFVELGFRIKATEGTLKYLSENGIPGELSQKLHENRPNIVDEIKSREIQLVINTPLGRRGQDDDSYIRKAAVKYKVPYITTLAGAWAAAEGIAACRKGGTQVKSIQAYHREITD
jgi:carbamoyl-phosphate synthase large subunit